MAAERNNPSDKGLAHRRAASAEADSRSDRNRVRSNDSKQKQLRVRSVIAFWRRVGVAAFAAVMILGGVVGLLFFARPSSSAVENRNLTEFPAFTVESFLDGSFFTGASLWYADTYPLREKLVSANRAMDKLHGLTVNRGLVGGNVQADAIPVGDPASEPDAPAAVRRERPAGLAEAPDERMVAAAVQDSIMNGLYIKDGIAYSICYFNQSGADTYIEAVNRTAEELDGVAHVYSLLVPSSAVVLPEEEYDAIGGSDQRAVFDYVWARFDSRVTHVDLLDTMRAHGGDYVFFRTDHHWTPRGAYCGYVEFCNAKGTLPKSLDSFAYANSGDFYGSYYESIAELMDPYVDEFETYTPASVNEMVKRDNDGTETMAAVVEDTNDWGVYGKYDALSGCDPALGIIHNPQLDDGSSCLIVKDSYGSAFAPFLVDDYEYVYVLDPRVYYGNICAFAREHDVKDVVFVYGVKVAINEVYATILLDTFEEG